MAIAKKRTFPKLNGMSLFLISILSLSILPAFSIWFFPWHNFSDNNKFSYMLIMIIFNCVLWIISVSAILNLLIKQKTLVNFLQIWKKQQILLFFFLSAFFSIFWSISPLITTYKVVILIGSTIFGAFLGYRFDISHWLEFLFWFGALLIILCLVFVFMFPGLGTMPQYPYFGAWCGIFWNRNQLGSLMAIINSIILIRIFSDWNLHKSKILFEIVFYILSVLLIYKASSATGYILTIILTAIVLLINLWLRYNSKMQKKHYLIILGLFAVAVIWIFTNLNFILELFNRSSSLTGRIPMWTYLFQNVVVKSPWIGYGFGAIWSSGPFRTGLSQIVGWLYPVTIGDNGFVDIILYLGIVGLILFLGIIISAFIRAVRVFLSRPSLINSFPLLFMTFAIISNISFSLFFETESLVWLIMVAILFLPLTKHGETNTIINHV